TRSSNGPASATESAATPASSAASLLPLPPGEGRGEGLSAGPECPHPDPLPGGEGDIGLMFDLAVIGGGVKGCGIARDAAGRGLSVVLLEKGDLGGATPSASTKLIHG